MLFGVRDHADSDVMRECLDALGQVWKKGVIRWKRSRDISIFCKIFRNIRCWWWVQVSLHCAGRLALLRFGTRVTVVAPDIRAEFQALQAQYGQEYVCLQQKKFTPGMTTGYDIVLAATDSPETDHSIWEECKKHGIRVSVASNQTLCDFRFPALIEKDNIVVGVTSNDSDHRNVREISARIRETLGTENRNIDRAEKQDSKESEYQRKEMSAGRSGSEEKNQ